MSDIIGSLIVIGASVFFFVHTLSFTETVGTEQIGAGFWPRLNLIGMVILALFIMIRSLVRRKKAALPKNEPQEEMNTVGVVICGAILLSFVLLMPYIGFLLSAFLGMMALIYALGERKKLVIFLTAFVLVLVVYLSFGKFLFVPMPRGVSIFRELSFYLY